MKDVTIRVRLIFKLHIDIFGRKADVGFGEKRDVGDIAVAVRLKLVFPLPTAQLRTFAFQVADAYARLIEWVEERQRRAVREGWVGRGGSVGAGHTGRGGLVNLHDLFDLLVILLVHQLVELGTVLEPACDDMPRSVVCRRLFRVGKLVCLHEPVVI